eukprot:gene38987-48148_t
MGAQRSPMARLATIAGTVPELVDLPTGCTFAGRCSFTAQACHSTRPQATVVARDAEGVHEVRCLRPEAMQAPTAAQATATISSFMQDQSALRRVAACTA